jgi:hypothetical protein
MMITSFSWQDFDFAIDHLTGQIIDSEIPFDNIYGIPRGGLIPAVSLSHRLNLPLIVNGNDITKTTLIVDDIADSGKRLTLFPDLYIATIHLNPTSIVIPRFFVHSKNSDWVVYPWEMYDERQK